MGAQAGAIDCGAGSTTITGLPDRPYCILFLGTNQTTYESAFTATYGGGFLGFAVEDGDGNIHNYCEFAILTTGRCSNLTQTCARTMATAGGILVPPLYEASVTAITSDGFTVTFSQTASGYQIHYLAFWDIQPGNVFPYEPLCDGIVFPVDVGFPPAVYFALGQWRGTCHTFPKATSSSLWNAASMGDVVEPTSTWTASARSTIAGYFHCGVDLAGGASTIYAGLADPFVVGSICTGVDRISHSDATEITLENVGCGDRYDWIHAQMSECMVGDCLGKSLGAGAIDSEVELDFTARVGIPEAVILNNFQTAIPLGSLSAQKTWGFGFATPDYQCGFSISENDGSMYQSAVNSWVSKTFSTFASYGQVDFEPTSGDASLVVKGNAAGDGDIGLMGVITSCEDWIPQIYRYVFPPPASTL